MLMYVCMMGKHLRRRVSDFLVLAETVFFAVPCFDFFLFLVLLFCFFLFCFFFFGAVCYGHRSIIIGYNNLNFHHNVEKVFIVKK